MARFNGATAQQDFILPYRKGTDNQPRILIMYFTAAGTYMTRAVVIRWDTQFDRGTAKATKFHGGLLLKSRKLFKTSHVWRWIRLGRLGEVHIQHALRIVA